MLILFLLQMSDVKKYGALNGEKHVKSDLNHVSKSDLNPIWNLNLFLQKLDFMSNTPPPPPPSPILTAEMISWTNQIFGFELHVRTIQKKMIGLKMSSQ